MWVRFELLIALDKKSLSKCGKSNPICPKVQKGSCTARIDWFAERRLSNWCGFCFAPLRWEMRAHVRLCPFAEGMFSWHCPAKLQIAKLVACQSAGACSPCHCTWGSRMIFQSCYRQCTATSIEGNCSSSKFRKTFKVHGGFSANEGISKQLWDKFSVASKNHISMQE